MKTILVLFSIHSIVVLFAAFATAERIEHTETVFSPPPEEVRGVSEFMMSEGQSVYRANKFVLIYGLFGLGYLVVASALHFMRWTET